jgi:gamma-glutamyltranspeptidase / glutathione hydrolase
VEHTADSTAPFVRAVLNRDQLRRDIENLNDIDCLEQKMCIRAGFMSLRIAVVYLAILIPMPLSAAGRIPAYARNGMVASTSKPASRIGRDILARGGNAVDAAVATGFALAVSWPSAGNIGGGGFLVFHGGDGTVTTFDFREKAPLAATREMYLGPDGRVRENANHDGYLSIGVPGTVAGLYMAHQKLGKLPWRDVVAPAVKLAEVGFPFTWALHGHVTGSLAKHLDRYPSSAAVMRKADGSSYQPGEIWKQPDLARTLARIRDNGHDGFYRGETAQKLADYVTRKGGIITTKDLAEYSAVERRPVHGLYRGHDVYAMAPPSSGGIAIVEMLNILEAYDLAAMGHNSAAYLHVLTEAMRRAFADRAKHLGDPDFNPDMPVDRLLSKQHAERVRSSIDLTKASLSDSSAYGLPYEGTETTHYSVVDADRNAVSVTYTLEQSYGSKIVAEGLGFFLNNEMGDFNPVPGRTSSRGMIGTPPNWVAPEKRMLSSMTPTIVAKNGKPAYVIGSPGGRTIINTVLQVVLNVVDHDMGIARAVEAGRIHHQWLPDITTIETWAISPDTRKLYEALGHKVRTRQSQGRVMAIAIDYDRGRLEGAADSRSADGGVAGY